MPPASGTVGVGIIESLQQAAGCGIEDVGSSRVGAAGAVFGAYADYHTVSVYRNRATEIVVNRGSIGVGVVDRVQQAARCGIKDVNLARFSAAIVVFVPSTDDYIVPRYRN